VGYVSKPQIIGAVISRRLATLHELETVYGTQDLYDLMEIIAVDDYNQGVMNAIRT
jgi:hypothetical protein